MSWLWFFFYSVTGPLSLVLTQKKDFGLLQTNRIASLRTTKRKRGVEAIGLIPTVSLTQQSVKSLISDFSRQTDTVVGLETFKIKNNFELHYATARCKLLCAIPRLKVIYMNPQVSEG